MLESKESKNRIKLVYCIPSLHSPGGMERVLTTKVNYLSRFHNYEITLITTEGSGEKSYFKLSNTIKVVHFDINFDRHYNLSMRRKLVLHYQKMRQYQKALHNYLSTNNVDICISLFGKEIDFIAKMNDQSLKVGEIHFAKNYHYQFAVANDKGWLYRIVGIVRTKQIEYRTKRLKKIIVLTKADENHWLKSHTNILQVYNPVQRLDLAKAPLKAKRVIAIGRLDAQKGFDVLITIWSKLSLQYSNWVLDIFGSGEQYDYLQDLIIDHQLEDRVFLRGSSQHITKELVSSSLLLMTSKYEGFGLVLLEAMACGLPCIAFDCNHGPREIIIDGSNGFLIPNNDIEMFTSKLSLLLEDFDLRVKFGNQARITTERFSLDRIMDQWNELFLGLVNARG